MVSEKIASTYCALPDGRSFAIGAAHESTMKDLKRSTLRGGLARFCALCTNLLVRAVSLLILSRILHPRDFGLVGMVTALTGILVLLRDFGLSSAAIQRATVTDEQLSTLFWI